MGFSARGGVNTWGRGRACTEYDSWKETISVGRTNAHNLRTHVCEWDSAPEGVSILGDHIEEKGLALSTIIEKKPSALVAQMRNTI